MDTMNLCVMANVPAIPAVGEKSAYGPISASMQHAAVVPFRARTRGGAALIDLSLAPDSAPWIPPA
jgi:hypothetical protein